MDRRQFLLSSVGALVSAVTAKTGLDWRGKRLSAQETRIEEMVRGPSITLRSLADKVGIDIGAGGINTVPFYKDPDYKKIIAREFTSLTPGNAMKFGVIHPRNNYGDERDYNFEHADAMLEFAEASKMKVRGHTLVWHMQNPRWLDQGNFDRRELIQVMEDHIRTIVSRYKDRVFAWDVVNEPLTINHESIPIFQGIGPEYIPLAFRFAHEADPSALLFYNETQAHNLDEKSNMVYEQVCNLLDEGVTIHGVGMQMHVSLRYPPNLVQVAKNMRRLGNLGLKVHVTEMDVKTETIDSSTEDKLEKQAKIYGDITKVCLDEEVCTSIATWGVTDRYSWLKEFTKNPEEKPLLFDADYRAKPSYYAVKRKIAESYTS